MRMVDPVDHAYRQQMNRQLTVRESRHKRAGDVRRGKRGTIHQAYRDGIEDQLGELRLALNAIVLWTTKCIDGATAQLRAEGHEIRDQDIARLSARVTRPHSAQRTSCPVGTLAAMCNYTQQPGPDFHPVKLFRHATIRG
nr:Tn3 family transposase [Streptomyces sp. 150FB]